MITKLILFFSVLFVASITNAQQVLLLQEKKAPRNFLTVPTPKNVSLKLWNGKMIVGQLTSIEKNDFIMDGSQAFCIDSVKFIYFYNPNPYKYIIGTYAGFSFVGTTALTVAILSNDRAKREFAGLIPVLVFFDVVYFTTSYLMLNLKRKIDLRSWNKIILNSPEGNNMRFHME